MSTAEARSILLRVDHGESVKVKEYVLALAICAKSGARTVSAFLSRTIPNSEFRIPN